LQQTDVATVADGRDKTHLTQDIGGNPFAVQLEVGNPSY
jgi:hypothetical protein